MAVDARKNFAYSTIAVAPSPADSGTTLEVQTGDGAKFAAVSFNAVVWPQGVQPTTANAEIVRVTNKGSGDDWTITREQESTSARTIIVGDQIMAGLTDKALKDIEDYLTGVTSPTLLTPTIASLTNAQHNHTNAAGGGTLAESALALTDVTTNDTSTTKHGFAPKAVAGKVLQGAAYAGLSPIWNHIESGCIWSGDSYASTLNASMTSGVAWIAGVKLTVAAVSARAFTASKDTYFDIQDNGDGTASIYYTEVANNAASPALGNSGTTANTIRVAIIVSGASSIASVAAVNQGQEGKVLPIASSLPYMVTDSLGNLICPRDPNRRVLGYRRIIASVGPNGCATSDADITGVAVPFIAPGDRKVKVTLHGTDYEQTGGVDTIYGVIRVRESTTRLGMNCAVVPSAANLPNGYEATGIITPSAGLHTYKMSVNNNSTGPNYTIGASSDDFTYIMVELA